jgi:hypothetical protein
MLAAGETSSSPAAGATTAEAIAAASQALSRPPQQGTAGTNDATTSQSTCSNSRSSSRGSREFHELLQQYPTSALMSVNTVLFGRHGYGACNRWGDTRWV